jgi:hypothetical protein
MGKNKKSRREDSRRGITLIKIILCHHKNFRGAHQKERNGKNRARSGTTTVLP